MKTTESELHTVFKTILARDPEWHAFSALHEERAFRHARALDSRIAQGQAKAILHGVAVAVKDLIDIAGHITSFGSRVYNAKPAAGDAPVIARLENAGALIVGSTNMVEFAMGSWGTNYGLGTPKNPVDSQCHRVPGGSSSGSAVAVAAGMVPAAIGSDTGGSIRIPAALCGLVGFKPSFGVIPVEGVAPLGPSFDTLGPITRDVGMARTLFSVLGASPVPRRRMRLADCVIGILDRRDLEPIDPDIAEAYEAAVDGLQAEGAKIERISLPMALVEFQKLNGDIVAHEAYAHLGHLAEDHRLPMDAFVRRRVLLGKDISRETYHGLQHRRDALVKQAARNWHQHIILMPTSPMTARPIAEVDELTIPYSRFTRLANCLDFCAISIPFGHDHHNLPIGLQAMMTHGNDGPLLDFAEHLERIASKAAHAP